MKFKVGDRVKVYNGGIFTGIVSFINDRNEPWLEIVCDEDKLVHGPFHFKQCRRLIKKSKLNYIVNGITVTIVEPVKPNPVYFSSISQPEEFPKQKSINCFHPKIANFVVNVLKWLNKWKQ